MKTITDGSLNIEEWSRPPNICTDSLFVFIHPAFFFFKFHLCLVGLPDHFGRREEDTERRKKMMERRTAKRKTEGG